MLWGLLLIRSNAFQWGTTQKLPLPLGMRVGRPSITPGAAEVHNSNGISIGSWLYPTDTPLYSLHHMM